MKSRKKLMAIILTAIFLVSIMHHGDLQAKAATTSKYLVLVEQKDGSWKSYTNLIEKSPSGNFMIKASVGSKALGLTYKNNSDGTFTIRRSSTRYNSYKKNSKTYTYVNGSKKTNKTSTYKAYTSSSSKSNLVHVSTLSTLINYKSFGSTEAKKYGYTGIACYSAYNKISTAIPTAKATPEPTKIPTATPTPTKKPSGSTTIEGVKFENLDDFLTVGEAGDGWGTNEDALYDLKNSVDGSVTASTALYVESNTITYSHAGASDTSISLKKSGDTYKLTIGVRLTGDEIGKQNSSIVKAMVATISSSVSTVYQAIYDSFETDNLHGLNDSSYVTIGDSKIKVDLSVKGEVTYIIKSAN